MRFSPLRIYTHAQPRSALHPTPPPLPSPSPEATSDAVANFGRLRAAGSAYPTTPDAISVKATNIATKLRTVNVNLAGSQADMVDLLDRYDAAVAAEAHARFSVDENDDRVARARVSFADSEAPASAAEAAADRERARAAAAEAASAAACESADTAEAVNAALVVDFLRLTAEAKLALDCARSIDAESETEKLSRLSVAAESAVAKTAALAAAGASRSDAVASAVCEAAARETHALAVIAADEADAEEAEATAEHNRLQGYLVTSFVRDRSKLVSATGAEQKEASAAHNKTMTLIRKRSILFSRGHAGVEASVVEEGQLTAGAVALAVREACNAVLATQEACATATTAFADAKGAINTLVTDTVPEAESRASAARIRLSTVVRERVSVLTDTDLTPALSEVWTTFREAHMALIAMGKVPEVVQAAVAELPPISPTSSQSAIDATTAPLPDVLRTPTKAQSEAAALAALTPMARAFVGDPCAASLWAPSPSLDQPAALDTWLKLGYATLRTAAVAAGFAGAGLGPDVAIVTLPVASTLAELRDSDSALLAALIVAKGAINTVAEAAAGLATLRAQGATLVIQAKDDIAKASNMVAETARENDELALAKERARRDAVDTSDQAVTAAAKVDLDASLARVEAASDAAFDRLKWLRSDLEGQGRAR